MCVLDRFEGESAIIERGGETLAVPRARITHGAKEGDVLIERGGFYTVDAAETARRARRLRKKLDSLFRGDHL